MKKCKLCDKPIQWKPDMNIPQLTICAECFKDCDCCGLDKL